MQLLWLALCVVVLWQVPQGDSHEEQSVYIAGPEDDPLFQWHTRCFVADEPMYDLMTRMFPAERARFYDLTAGFGGSFLRLASIVGEQGAAIGVDRNATLLAYLNDNISRLNFWSRSLIITNFNASDSFGQYHEKKFFRDLFVMLSSLCPDVMLWRENGQDFQDLSTVFNDVQFLLHACTPALFLDFQRADMIVPIAQSLLAFSSDDASKKRYLLYLRPLCCAAVEQQRYLLIAVAKHALSSTIAETLQTHEVHSVTSTAEVMSTLKRLKYQCASGMAVEDELNDMAISNDNADEFSGLEALQRQLQGRYLGNVQVQLDLIYHPLGPIHCVHKHIIANPRLSVLSPEHFHMSVKLFDDSFMEMDNFNEMRLKYRCTQWIDSIVEQMRLPLEELSNCHHHNLTWTLLLFNQDKTLMMHNCFRFTESRYHFLQQIDTRRMSKLQDNLVFPQRSISKGQESSLVTYRFHSFSEFSQDLIWFSSRPPLKSEYEPDVCAEPVFCSNGERFREAVLRWQHPPLSASSPNASSYNVRNFSANYTIPNTFPHSSCEDARFLVYEPPSYHHGLGSMFLLLSSALRYAICLDRILLLAVHYQEPTLLKWRPEGCVTNTFECYFEPISSCSLTQSQLERVPLRSSSRGFDEFPLRSERILYFRGLPDHGPCALCFEEWKQSSSIFDGLLQFTFRNQVDRDVIGETFMGSQKLSWHSQLTRAILQPRQWLSNAMQEIAHSTMLSPLVTATDTHTNEFPSVFVSLHVRHGMKAVETDLFPLGRYMTVLKRKFPLVRDIFVSTETMRIIHELIQDYPEYRVHYLDYDRIEYLALNVTLDTTTEFTSADYPAELLYSLTNLYVSTEASGFLGTLTSSWCMLIEYMERTRGDGGFEYFSVDRGSSFTTCY